MEWLIGVPIYSPGFNGTSSTVWFPNIFPMESLVIPLVNNIASGNGIEIVDLPMKNGDFP